MAFCVGCGKQLANDERFCPKCGVNQTAAAGNAPGSTPLGTPPQYPPPAGMVPVVAMPPAAGIQSHGKVLAVVIGAAALFAVYHFSNAPQQRQSGSINLIFVVSDDLAYQSSGDLNPNTAI